MTPDSYPLIALGAFVLFVGLLIFFSPKLMALLDNIADRQSSGRNRSNDKQNHDDEEHLSGPMSH